MTPILPTHEVVVWVLTVNVLLVAALLIIVAWESWRLIRAWRAGAAAARLHVNVVGLFSLVAALPAVLVAVVASAILTRSLDPWFTGSLKALMSNTVEIAQAYRDSQCQTLARDTQLMASDINRAKVLFDADRKLFSDFMTSRASFLGFPLAMLVRADASSVERIELRTLPDAVIPTLDDLKDANAEEALCLIPRSGNVFRSVLRLAAYDGQYLYVARPVDPRAIEFGPIADAGAALLSGSRAKKAGNPGRLRVHVRTDRAHRPSVRRVFRSELRQQAGRAHTATDPRDGSGRDRQFLRPGSGPTG
jgi:two-component system nitrogen regulation sensor histidine kinase NtrY